jgi:ketosteroid isomerase-like protein
LRVLGWLTLVGLAGVPASQSQALQCSAELPAVQAIRSVATGIVAADNRRDIESVMAYYARDAVLMPPNEAPVAGRDLIRPRYEELFAAFTPEIVPRIDEACVDGRVGFVRGHNGGRLIPRTTGEARALDDGFLMLLRLDSAGLWKISHLIWHRQSPPRPAR